MRKIGAFVIALAISGTTQAIADDTTEDMRCLVVSLNMASSEDVTLKNAGMVSTFYWMGRLDGRTPDLDMESRIIAETNAMTPTFFQSEAARCGTFLQGRGKVMTDMGRDITEKARAAAQQQNSR